MCIDDEIPFEIPESWEWCRLVNICSFISRGKSPKYSDENIIPVFAQKCNLKDGGISLDQARFLDPTTIDKWSEEYRLKTDDVLVNSTGTGTVCRTRLFNEQYLGKYPFVVPDSHVSVVRTFEDIKSQYVYAYLSSNIAQQYLEDNLAGSTNQKELYIGVLKSLIIPIPSFNEQQRIADCVDSIDVIINNVDVDRSELFKIVKQTKAKVLDLAIRGKLVPQDPSDEPASVLLERIKAEKEATSKSSKRGIKKATPTADNSHCQLSHPNSWVEVDFDNVFDVVASKPYQILQSSIKQQGLYPVISQSSNYIEGYSDNDDNIYKVNKAVIIFGDHTRIVKLIDFDFIVGADGVKILQPLFYEKYAYLVMLYNSSITTNKGYSRHFQYLTKHKISLPPLNEQKRIVGKVEEIFTQLDGIEKALME